MIIKLRSLNGVCSTIHLIRKKTNRSLVPTLCVIVASSRRWHTHTYTHRRQLLLLLLICCIRLFLFDSFQIFAFLRRSLCLLSVSSIYVHIFSRSRCTFDRNRIEEQRIELQNGIVMQLNYTRVQFFIVFYVFMFPSAIVRQFKHWPNRWRK